MKHNYKTAQVAEIMGVHVNTVRLYEKYGLIPKAHRQSNGYRVFQDFHIEQFRLARIALEVEILQSGLRKKIIQIIKLSAEGRFDRAIACTHDYINQVRKEQRNAEEAIEITKKLLTGITEDENDISFTRKQTAEYLQITMDTLRNWEMNGLISVKRRENGYRIYTMADIQRLKMIRSLRCANYSLAAILRMIHAVSRDMDVDIREVINSPEKEEDIVTVCDKLLTSLASAEANAECMLSKLKQMKDKFI